MQVRSDARPRALSAPAALGSRSRTAPPGDLDATRTCLNDALQRADGLLPADLREHLTRYAQSGGDLLDLGAHGPEMKALSAAGEAAFDEVMAALSAVCAARGASPTSLALPPGLHKLPGWAKHFGTVTELRVPHFHGKRLDARSLPGLRQLDLGETVPRALTLRVPTGCDLVVTHPDTKPAKVTTTLHRRYKQLQLKWRPLDFNCLVDRNEGKEKYVCRHLAMEKTRLWEDESLRWHVMEPSPDPLGSRSAIAQNVGSDTESLVAQLGHRPRKACLVAHSHWGDFARHQFEQMKREGRETAIALVATTSVHAMAIRFVARPPQAPCIELWDPNFTNISTFSEAPFDFEAMFHDFNRVKEVYFGTSKHAFGSAPHIKIILIDNPLDPLGSVAPTARQCAVSVAFAGLPQQLHPDLVREIIEHGFSDQGLEQLVQAIRSEPLTREQCLALLTAADEHAFPALYRAVDLGHHRAHTATAKCLLVAFQRGLLSELDVRNVMMARGALKTALALAYSNGDHAVVTDLACATQQLFKQGALSQRSVYHLMRGAHNDRLSTIVLIKDLKTAVKLQKRLKELHASGALAREDYKELLNEAREVQADLRDAAKERKRAAKVGAVANPLARV